MKLPKVLFTTSTRDDRVHPGHARKMAARMREQGHRAAVLGEHRRRPRRRRRQRAARAHVGAGIRFLWQQLRAAAEGRRRAHADWIDDHTPAAAGAAGAGRRHEAPGLLAAGGRVTPARLEEAYRKGIFPWYGPGQPVLWWSPDPRMVLPVAEFRLTHSLRKTLRRFRRTPGCEVRFDSAFRQVITACARTPREGQDGTWIVPAMVEAYVAWHQAGRVHSVETWIDGRTGAAACTSSASAACSSASRCSRTAPTRRRSRWPPWCLLPHRGITLIDCQQNTGHLASWARASSRARVRAPPGLTLGAGEAGGLVL
jgi:leucyl/phenylalanyl-tRNA---protein transferase